MMSYSSTNLVFVQLDLSSYVQGTTGYKDKLHLSPRQLDVKVKTCTLPIGAELAVFSQEQTVSGGVKVEKLSLEARSCVLAIVFSLVAVFLLPPSSLAKVFYWLPSVVHGWLQVAAIETAFLCLFFAVTRAHQQEHSENC